MQKKSLIQSNPHLRAPEQYRKALVANVSSSTAIETGATVASIAKALKPGNQDCEDSATLRSITSAKISSIGW